MLQRNLAKQSAFRQGLIAGIPFVLVITPFGLLFGVIAIEAGFSILEALVTSIMIIAGSAQFTAVALVVEDTPVLIIILTSLAVNLRMALYSAVLAKEFGRVPFFKRAFLSYFLTDQTYALSELRISKIREESWQDRAMFFMGTAALISPFWYLSTLIGAAFGTTIPPEFALDFAVPLTFIALFAPMLRSPAHWAAALTSIICSLLFVGFPYGLGLLSAGAVAIVVGALTEAALERRSS